MSNDIREFEGGCHCGAIRFTYRASTVPEGWTIRACQCSFCRAHGVRMTSDASGAVMFDIPDPDKLQRYRFGLGSADFFICRFCGVYVAAVMTSPRGQFATINVNALRGPLRTPEATPVTYDGESADEKQARREQRWTPLASPV